MSKSKTILSIIVLFILSNVLTTIWYMLTDEANLVPFRRDEPNFIGLTLNHLVFVCGFVYLFPFYIREQNTRLKSIIYGAVLAFIMFLPTGIVVRSIWKVDFNTIFILNTLAHGIIGAILGLVINVIYNYKKQ